MSLSPSSPVTASRSPPPTSAIPLICLSDEDDIDGPQQKRSGDGAAFSATAVRVVEALEMSGFLLVKSHHLPLDLQRRALRCANNIFRRHHNAPGCGDTADETSPNQRVVRHPTDPKSYMMVNCQSDQTIEDDVGDNNHDVLVMTQYIEALESVKVQLLELIAVGLDLPKEFFVNLHQKRNDALRLLQYHPDTTTTTATATITQSSSSSLMRPITTNDEDEQEQESHSSNVSTSRQPRLRCKAHSDYGTITLLLTDGKPGLQAFVKKPTPYCDKGRSYYNDDDNHEIEDESNNKRKRYGDLNNDNSSSYQEEEFIWVDVPHVEGAVVVNIGSILSEWTNGRLLATLHRVTFTDEGSDLSSNVQKDRMSSPTKNEGVPSKSSSSTTRTSLAFFADPDPDVSINLGLDSAEGTPKGDGNMITVAEYIEWRSGGTMTDRTGVALTDMEEKRIHPKSESAPSI